MRLKTIIVSHCGLCAHLLPSNYLSEGCLLTQHHSPPWGKLITVILWACRLLKWYIENQHNCRLRPLQRCPGRWHWGFQVLWWGKCCWEGSVFPQQQASNQGTKTNTVFLRPLHLWILPRLCSVCRTEVLGWPCLPRLNGKLWRMVQPHSFQRNIGKSDKKLVVDIQ